MNMKLTFLGAAQNVTGSCYLLEPGDGTRVLVDCGLYQERDFKNRNWDAFPVLPASVNAVLLTHGHLDHCGLLPKLVREGFKGRIYCTPATAEVAKIIILDSAKIQEEDALFKQKRHAKEGRQGPYPIQPLYTIKDAESALPRITPVKPGSPVPVCDGVTASFFEAGHIIGSSSVMVRVKQKGEERSILFSGDIGRWNAPILRDPTLFTEADYVLTESTYGDRDHGDEAGIPGQLADVVNAARKAGGNIVIPSFAVERTQELLYHLSGLLREDRIPHLAVFVDSPMAVRVTEVFTRHPELFDEETLALIRQGKHPCDFPGLVLCRSVDESKAINHIKGTVIIIAGSGMCNAGRIKHHLVNNVSRPESTVLFVGYQAVGTLGRSLSDGAKEVRIFGQTRPVKATVVRINGFSAHAGQGELLRWVTALKRPPRRVFVTHGEPEAAEAYAGKIRSAVGWPVTVPAYREQAVLD